MVASKAERHHVAWETYLERRDICGVELREAVEGVTAGCKDELSALDEAIQEEASQLEDSSLMVLDEHNVMGAGAPAAWGAISLRMCCVARNAPIAAHLPAQGSGMQSPAPWPAGWRRWSAAERGWWQRRASGGR